jgi:hypothetical protein
MAIMSLSSTADRAKMIFGAEVVNCWKTSGQLSGEERYLEDI